MIKREILDALIDQTVNVEYGTRSYQEKLFKVGARLYQVVVEHSGNVRNGMPFAGVCTRDEIRFGPDAISELCVNRTGLPVLTLKGQH